MAAAWELSGGTVPDGDAEVTVYEPGHLGGKLRTSEFCGRMVDEGPDSMLTRLPYALDLCRELGLADQLIAPQAAQALLYVGGKARPFPPGLVMGAPSRLGPVLRSGILSPLGMARACLDLVKRRPRLGDDVGVYELVSSRFGPEVAEKLVEPLLGSIHAGTTRGLSAAATAPQLIAASRSRRSLLLGLRHIASPPTAKTAAAAVRPPLFVAPVGGMQTISDALWTELVRRNVTVRAQRVGAVHDDGDALVTEPDGERYDGAVLAVPAGEAAGLVSPLADDPTMAVLAGVRYASVAVATLAVDASEVPVSPDLSGVLVAPGSGLLMTACSFGSHKWPSWSAPGVEVLRVSVGKAGDETWAELSDEALVERLCTEVGRTLGSSRRPLPALSPKAWRVNRWPAAFPQFEVGHLQRVAAARAAMARNAPRLALAGASYEGAGVPACIGSGRRAAASVREAARARART